MTHKFTLPAFKRLKSQKQIAKLFDSGKSQFIYPFKMLYLIENRTDDQFPVVTTVSVPKRKIKSAVKRNLIKRRTREAYRVSSIDLQNLLLERKNVQLSIMFVYIENESVDYAAIEKSIGKHLKKLIDEVIR